MNPQWLEWVKKVHEMHYQKLSETREEATKLSSEELTDIGYLLKKQSEYLDDLRKETDKLRALVEKIACLRSVAEEKDKFRGRIATGTPQVQKSANIPHPKKDPDNFLKLCAFLGIPEEAVMNDLIRVHWPGMKEFITKRLEEGKPIPPGLSTEDLHTHYSLRYRKR
jgi:CHASE3 domain sensor protein